MPYKHIAAHLNKTELACRLHYHQLSHGSNRRKRALSTASTSSSCSSNQSPNSSQYSLSEAGDFGSTYNSRQASPMGYGSASPFSHDNSPNRNPHKLLLPKPRTLTPQDSPEPLMGLRINTTVQQGAGVDTDRLRAIYESRRASFWASIAAEYGQDVSPSHLEDIWRSGSGHMTYRPPTPEDDLYARSMLKPSPFPPYPSSAISPIKEFPSQDRMPYMLPTPTPSGHAGLAIAPPAPTSMPAAPTSYPKPNPGYPQYASPSMGSLSRTSSWSTGQSNIPATAIAAILTEDRNPKP